MLRISSLLSVLLMLATAFGLYAINQVTRGHQLVVSDQERRIEELRRDIAVLEADAAYLARPERLEPFARELGMVPMAAEQRLSGDAALARLERSATGFVGAAANAVRNPNRETPALPPPVAGGLP